MLATRRSARARRALSLTLALGVPLLVACGGSGARPRSASAKVGPAGGTVALGGGPTLDVPAGALSADTTLSVSATAGAAPGGRDLYELGPAGTTFAAPVTVTLPLPAGLAAPAVYWSKPGSTTSFDVLPATVGAGAVQAQGTHFSRVFVGPSSGSEMCASAGTGSDGLSCGEGLACAAGVCRAVFAVSGTVTGAVHAGVTVTLGGDATATTTTDAGGAYAFAGLLPGTYTVTPSLQAHGFTPASATVTLTDGDATQDFAEWQPVLQAVSPAEGHVGSQVTLTGSAFGASAEGGSVTLAGQAMAIVSWTGTQIVATVPGGVTGGPVQVHVGTGDSTTRPFTVTATVAGRLVDGGSALAGSWAFGGDGQPARLRVTAVGAGRAAVATGIDGVGYGGLPRAFSLELPVGATYTLAVDASDAAGDATVDLLQAGSGQVAGIVVDEGGVAGLDIPLRWHWEVHALDPGVPVCNFEKQVWFRDALHGFVTFQVDADVDQSLDPARASKIHGLVMATSDGGQTWSVASRDMSVGIDDFRPTAAGWFGGGHLLALDGGTVLSVGDNGKLVRSTDDGATWAPGSLNWATVGPGGAFPTRFARDGERLWMSIRTGSVQGSTERSQLVTSTDAGLTWSRRFDVCNVSAYAPGGCPTQGVPLGFAGIDIACSDANPGHCVTMGYEHDNTTSLVMATVDGFETFTTIPSPCGWFTDGTVLWFPGTSTAWVIASTSCGGGYRYIETTDGGATWTDWAPSPVGGRVAFADATHGVSWWDSGVWRTTGGVGSWRYTGHAPGGGAALRTVHQLDADHLWVLGHPDCRTSSAAYVARWVP